MPKINEIDKRVLSGLDGRDRIKLLLRERGLQLQQFARKHNLWIEQVSMCLAGDRPYPEIRDAFAAELDLSREAIDAFIDAHHRAA